MYLYAKRIKTDDIKGAAQVRACFSLMRFPVTKTDRLLQQHSHRNYRIQQKPVRSCPLSCGGGGCLLGRNLCFHSPSCLENHLIPPLLEQCLPLVLVRAPRLSFARRRRSSRSGALSIAVLARLGHRELVLKFIPCN